MMMGQPKTYILGSIVGIALVGAIITGPAIAHDLGNNPSQQVVEGHLTFGTQTASADSQTISNTRVANTGASHPGIQNNPASNSAESSNSGTPTNQVTTTPAAQNNTQDQNQATPNPTATQIQKQEANPVTPTQIIPTATPTKTLPPATPVPQPTATPFPTSTPISRTGGKTQSNSCPILLPSC